MSSAATRHVIRDSYDFSVTDKLSEDCKEGECLFATRFGGTKFDDIVRGQVPGLEVKSIQEGSLARVMFVRESELIPREMGDSLNSTVYPGGDYDLECHYGDRSSDGQILHVITLKPVKSDQSEHPEVQELQIFSTASKHDLTDDPEYVKV